MGWILGFLALLVIWACVEVGLLYSILTIGIVGGVLYGMYTLHKKASQQDATEQDKQLANILRKVAIGISACLIWVGVVLGGIGLLNPETDGYKLQKCGYCGGSGRLTSGKVCGLCDGAGGTAYENSVYADFTWIGILMAASGAILWIGTAMLKETAENKELEADENTLHINTHAATLAISFGHWETGVFHNTWVSKEPDDSGAWTIRCNMKYLHKKEGDKIILLVTPYSADGSKIENLKGLSFTNNFFEGYSNTITWKDLWPGKQLDRLELARITIYFKDGTEEPIKL